MILAGDVGATKTLLGLFARAGSAVRVVREARFASADHDSLETIVAEFLAGERARIDACAVGVAGPVAAGRSAVVNLAWPVDAQALGRRLGTSRAWVLNDLEATAWGIPLLGSRQSASLTPGLPARPGNAALVAAGTGLGMAVLHWDGTRHRPSASEGGHQSFAPRDDTEIGLLKHLRAVHGRVSIERVVSGAGLAAIYRYLIASGRARESPRMRGLLDAVADPNAAIAQSGLGGADPATRRALDLFVSLYGAVAGDLALVANAVGGVWVGGGIAPQILPQLREGGFLRAFRDKGRLTPLVSRIPVRVILEPRTALLGAAAYAFERAPRAGRAARSRKR